MNESRALVAPDRLARAYVARAGAANTLRAYCAGWRHVAGWCEPRALAALPAAPQTLVYSLAEPAAGMDERTIAAQTGHKRMAVHEATSRRARRSAAALR